MIILIITIKNKQVIRLQKHGTDQIQGIEIKAFKLSDKSFDFIICSVAFYFGLEI